MPSECKQAVKEVLVEELERLSGGMGNGWFNIGGTLSYREKKHLCKELDPGFIDEQLAKMKGERKWPWVFGGSFLVLFAAMLAFGMAEGNGPWYFIIWTAHAALALFAAWRGHEQMRQRAVIYRALRALATGQVQGVSNAGETLSHAAKLQPSR